VKTAICTLFEGDYHYGLATLVNSLVHRGFQGVVWSGYRGQLPPWASSLEDGGCVKEFRVNQQCTIRFVPLETSAHFTNYKPQFMSQIFETLDPNIDALFYFDPDIVTKCSWSYFEQWVSCGIALVEDVNSPLPENHPRRCAWRRFYAKNGLQLRFATERYVNGGFVGIARKDRAFLDLWSRAQDIMAEGIGGLAFPSPNGAARPGEKHPTENPFSKTDQDALNAAVEAFSLCRFSIMGKEAMDFKPGGFTMSHAIGPSKPWRKKFIWSAINGVAPTAADKGFIRHSQTPIAVYSPTVFHLERLSLRLSSAVGRVVRRA
jgi:hypothetical protein